jgi:SAM-dependent methyltransferase
VTASAFTDPRQVTGHLYSDPGRITRRTAALHAAKIQGSDVADTIATLVHTDGAPSTPENVVDIGCGRGTTTLRLAATLPAARVIAVDRSTALLATARHRAVAADLRVHPVRADFHALPLPSRSADTVVAAFCLYHSAHPEQVLREIARLLRPRGRAVLVTKSADSYAELDQLVAAAGLDRDAEHRPSLYATFHTGNAADLAAHAFDVLDVRHELHRFRYTDPGHLAAYLSTHPKYQLPDTMAADLPGLARRLGAAMAGRPLTVTSTVTFVVARPG